MSKILNALVQLDNSVVPIVLPAGKTAEATVQAASRARPADKPRTSTAGLIREEYVDLAQRIRLKLRPPATLFVAPCCPALSDAWLAPLAISLAGSGDAPVLLVETRSQAAALPAIFGLPSAQGLNEAIKEVGDWKTLVYPTPIPNVLVLLAGQAARPLPTSVADRLSQLSKEWKQHFQWTIVSGDDATSIDTAAMACGCDGSLLVVPLDLAKKDEARRAARNLQSLGGQLIGSIARRG